MNRIFENPQALSEALAGYFAASAHEAVQERGRFAVCLTGGSSPVALYKLLPQEPYLSTIPWEKTWVFWGDERCVPDDDPENNARMAFEALLNHVPVPPEQIFRMNGVLEPGESASNYEAKLHAFFEPEDPSFDLVLLGMGDNAHILSLFPHTWVLRETVKWVCGLYIDEVKMSRITLTAELVNKARKLAFIVYGASKAATVAKVQNSPLDIENLPAQLIKPQSGELIWFLDEAAATKLSR